jgi:hypothetical protein
MTGGIDSIERRDDDEYSNQKEPPSFYLDDNDWNRIGATIMKHPYLNNNNNNNNTVKNGRIAPPIAQPSTRCSEPKKQQISRHRLRETRLGIIPSSSSAVVTREKKADSTGASRSSRSRAVVVDFRPTNSSNSRPGLKNKPKVLSTRRQQQLPDPIIIARSNNTVDSLTISGINVFEI